MLKKKILIIAPHADDEILGCGGTISKYCKMGIEKDGFRKGGYGNGRFRKGWI